MHSPLLNDFSVIRNGYELILDAFQRNDIAWSSLDTKIGKLFLGIFYYAITILSEISTFLGIGVINTVLIALVVYFAYKKGIKPYNFIQDTDIPSQTTKRKDINNLIRRLRRIGTKLPPPYPNSWYSLIESSEIGIEEIKQVDCIGHNFAVFRTSNGEAHVTDAYCPHLGASLAVGGAVKGDCIECPFHKWQFSSSTGKCVKIPNLDTVPKGIGVKRWTSAEVDGNIYVWFDINGEPPKWEIPSVDQIRNGDWIYHARNEFLVSSHVQDISENGADTEHFNAIHAASLLAGPALPSNDIWNIFGIHEWNGRWEPTEDPHEARVTITHDVRFFGKLSLFRLDVIARQIGPSLVHLILKHRLGTVVIIQTVTPVEPLMQKVIHRIYAPWYIRPIANIMMWGETTMFYRDFVIWNSKEYVYNPALIKTNKSIKAFRSWFQQFYSDNSLSFKDALLGPAGDVMNW